MRRIVAMLAVVVVATAAGIAVAVWLAVRDQPVRYPEISVYSHGHLIRVGPYRYCNVLNPNECQNPQTLGQLPVNGRDPVQLSVPTTIGRALWRLLQTYEDPRNDTETVFPPNTRLAATIPTVDPQRGRLTGVVVQVMTLVVAPDGELADVPHAEWSVQTVWSQAAP